MNALRKHRGGSQRTPMETRQSRLFTGAARTILGLVVLALMPATVVLAQSIEEEVLPPSERAWVASKMYAVASQHFAHWEAVPDLDFDDWYQKYLAKAMSANNRKEFSLASMEFLARLRNGHTVFGDSRLQEEDRKPIGFGLERLQGKWIVTSSHLENLNLGEEVNGIDDETMDAFFDRQQRFVYGSSERTRERRLFNMGYLFPEVFTLVLKSGVRFPIDKKNQTLLPSEGRPAPDPRNLENGIVYFPIRSFAKPEHEQQALEHIRRHRDAETLIIDVRGNGGGTTPTKLIEALMDRPWRDWITATPHRVGVESAYAHIHRTIPLEQLGERIRGYIQAFADADRSMLTKNSPLRQPQNPVFTNELIVLIDEGCASACEDFVMPLGFHGRARLIGRRTGGSSGQPYIFDFGNGMEFFIGSKRQYFPDGSAYEGVGIAPDIEVPRTIESLLSTTDETLDRAIQAARSRAR